jgi:malic enzyme
LLNASSWYYLIDELITAFQYSYIFPGLGLGAIVAGGTQITDDDFITAAEVLASHVTSEHLASGLIYPPLSEIRRVSRDIAAAVAAGMISSQRSTSPVAAAIAASAGVVVDASGVHALSKESVEALRRHCADVMYKPSYDFNLDL